MIVNLKEQHCENFLQSLHKEQWQEVRLGEVAEMNNGKARPKNYGGYLIYGGNGILGYGNQYNCDSETIIVGRVGAYCGCVYYEKQPIWVSDNAIIVKAKSENNIKFLYYVLKSMKLNDYALGSSHPLLTQNLLNTLQVEIPKDTTMQQKIAEILSSFDDKIDLLHRQNKTLESLALTLFRHYFIDNPNRSEWEEKPLKYFGNIICGKTPPKNQKEYFNGTYPFIKIPDMHNNVFVFQTADSLTQQGLDSQKAKTLPPFSVCVSCIATIGVVSMNANIAQTNQQINSIVPHKEHYRYFLYCSMKSSFDELEAMASGGTATANLNTTDFSNMKLLLPREKEILRFHTETLPFFDKIYNNTKQIQNLQAMRDVLLKAIFKERE
ncbi:restriction endonuclease subunit S [uncultured Helicobacter sp.]|uniref:restriction endonuclease subunit S n=1 Tax=uncultured Helicobacter sp. TaxID=175537 RepID=UPI0027DD08CA|nr:restriction endonuclease subunit S [uncultured Helicobacter sp.]